MRKKRKRKEEEEEEEEVEKKKKSQEHYKVSGSLCPIFSFLAAALSGTMTYGTTP